MIEGEPLIHIWDTFKCSTSAEWAYPHVPIIPHCPLVYVGDFVDQEGRTTGEWVYEALAFAEIVYGAFPG